MRRCGHRLDAHTGRGLIDQVDRLVRQVTILDVPIGQDRSGLKRLVGDLAPMVRLVAIAKPSQNLDGVIHRRLVDPDLLKPALERRVALEVLAILVECGRADGLELTARERWLEDRGRVDGALGCAGPNEVVQLVDEEDDVAPLADLLHHLLQALLELAAILRPGHKRSEVERIDLLALQELGHPVRRDARRQTLDNRRLADTRLADQHRVVLRAA